MKLNNFIDILNWFGIPLLLIYLFSMVIYPYFIGGWSNIHSVWHAWQTFNVGVLAFLSSLIAFNLSKYNADKQRKREFIAAASFLPQTLSDLCSHFEKCAQILSAAWERSGVTSVEITTTSPESFPLVMDSVKNVFSECIRHGSPVVGNHLADILKKLQISDARISRLHEKMGSPTNHLSRTEVKDNLFFLAELQLLINSTFPFSRGDVEFSKPSLNMDDINTAYLNLKLSPEIIDGMQDMTRDLLKRKGT